MNSQISSIKPNAISLEQRCLLQKRILEFRQAQKAPAEKIGIPRQPRTKGRNYFPASYAQEQAWFLSQKEPGSPSHNLSFAIRLQGAVELPALIEAFNTIVRRHEIFRTCFRIQDGTLCQVVDPELELVPEILDAGAAGASERFSEAEIRKRLENGARVHFDLGALPLCRVKILGLSDCDWIVLFTVHHIIWDGWSIGVFMKELMTLYRSDEGLPELAIQYADYAVWQRQWLDEDFLDKQLCHWEEILRGELPVLAMPLDRPRPERRSYEGELCHFRLGRALTSKVHELARNSEATLFMTLLSAFKVLLWRYTGQEDLLVATNVANRNCPEVEPLIGYFVNQILLRSRLDGSATFKDVIANVKRVTVQAFAHQDAPLDKVISQLRFDRNPARPGLFQAMFVLQNVPAATLDFGDLKVSTIPMDQHTANLDIHFSVSESEGELYGAIEYNTDIFERKTIELLALNYEKLLFEAVRDPGQPVQEYELITAKAPSPLSFSSENKCPGSVLELFRETVIGAGDGIAACIGEERLTYAELDRQSSSMAVRLRESGIGPDVLIGIHLERSLPWLVTLFAVWKAGGAFIPLDPGYPQEWLARMLEDSGATVVVTSRRLADMLPRHSGIELLVEEMMDRQGSPPQADAQFMSPDGRSLAYVIYTSGSSGKPKGVLIEHGGLANMALQQRQHFQSPRGTRFLQFASSSFDASIFEVVMALTSGGTLCLGNKEQLLPGAGLLRFLREQRIQVVTLPPSSLAMLQPDGLSDLKWVTVAGEACSERLAVQWGAGRRFFNLYGPTETTIWATACEWKPGEAGISIGQSIGNACVYVLGARMSPMAPGLVGEIYIGGAGVGRGYVNLPDLTAERFVPDPFSRDPGARLYRTGDLGRYLKNGNIEFVGRSDHQVKLRGFRIELGEIETAIKTFPAIRDAVVTVRGVGEEERALIAYVVPEEGAGADGEEIRDYLKGRLPAYMVPSAYVLMDRLPTTPNGKVDRHALPPCEECALKASATVEPRNFVEKKLVEIWRRLLKVESVGVTDDFFKLGGYSLLAVQIITEVYDALQVEIPVRFIFTMQLTVEELAKYIIERRESGDPPCSEESGNFVEKEATSLLKEQERELASEG